MEDLYFRGRGASQEIEVVEPPQVFDRVEIVMIQGEYCLRDRDGNASPLRDKSLQVVLLRNVEQFCTGKIDAVKYQSVYDSCLECELRLRGSVQEVAA